MKKVTPIISILLLCSLLSVHAQEVTDQQYKALQGNITKYSPLNEEGKVNLSKYQPFKTKAQERLDDINQWLDENVSWLKYFFHMKPQISLLFFLNLYCIFWFLMLLVIKAPAVFFFAGKHARLTGLAVFVAFMSLGLYVGIATFIHKLIRYAIDTLLPTAFIWGILLIIGIVLILIFIPEIVKPLMEAWYEYQKAKKEFKQEMAFRTKLEVIDSLVDGINKK
jgi:hypothetical protein